MAHHCLHVMSPINSEQARSSSAAFVTTAKQSSTGNSSSNSAKTINECMFGHVNQVACGGASASQKSWHCDSRSHQSPVPSETEANLPEHDPTCLARPEHDDQLARSLFAQVALEHKVQMPAKTSCMAEGDTVAGGSTRPSHGNGWCCGSELTHHQCRPCWSLAFMCTILARVCWLAKALDPAKIRWHALTSCPLCAFALSLVRAEGSSALWLQPPPSHHLQQTAAVKVNGTTTGRSGRKLIQPDGQLNLDQPCTVSEVLSQVCQNRNGHRNVISHSKPQWSTPVGKGSTVSSTRPRSMRTPFFLVALLVVVQVLVPQAYAQHRLQQQQLTILDIEETTTSPLAKQTSLEPKCNDHKSVCGYMQINNVGLNRVPICSCGNGALCPVWRNNIDTRTVRHGRDFYQYCTVKPKLNPCKPNEVAYSSFGQTDLVTGQKLADVQQVHCLCPQEYILKANKTMFEMLDTSYIYGTEQLCQKPPRCSRKQTCMSITETAESTLEKRHCRCPLGKVCLRDARFAFEKIQEEKGAIFNMRCISI